MSLLEGEDFEQTAEFLSLFSKNKNTQQCFQTYDDSELKRKSLARIINGDLKSCLPRLRSMQGEGAGLFFCVNKTDGKGRKAENITNVRAVFADFDNTEMPDFELEPSIVVESKRGKHAYWLLEDGVPLDEFTPIQRMISKKFKGDPKVKDLPRVMRLPNSLHKKNPEDPFKVKILRMEPKYYSIEEVKQGLGLRFEEKKNTLDTKNNFLDPITLKQLAEHGQAIEGKGGDEKTFTAGCILIKDNDLSFDEALPYLEHWNKDNRPPWSTEELRTKLENAAKYAKGEIKTENRIKLSKLSSLLSEPDEEIQWVIEDRLISVGTSLLVGKPKAGKTTMARTMALAVAKGYEALGSKSTKGSVIYLAAEENRQQFKNSIRSLEPDGDEELYIHTGLLPKDSIKQLDTILSDIKPRLVIVDTLFRVLNVADGNSYAEMIKALSPLQSLATKHGCHIMCLHHLGKVDRDGGDGILGSTAIYGAVDAVLIIERKKDERFLKTIQRYGDSLDSHILVFDYEKRSLSLGENKNSVMTESAEERIRTFLLNHGKATGKEIFSMVAGSKPLLLNALNSLVEKNEITRTGKGVRNGPYEYEYVDRF